MGIDEYTIMIEDIKGMSKLYKKVNNEIARKSYSKYIDLIIEQTDFSFEEKSDLRKYWRDSLYLKK